ncbi:hypothetical protein DVH24_016388 [Malus domestica]|uniref:Uncharacterized protein n=1 Tax=Malus domestica TaxID=3750 RepID=A0A498HQ31_MALDO|nr:hypothetical protein DVH24_016388 [Malus domestica]
MAAEDSGLDGQRAMAPILRTVNSDLENGFSVQISIFGFGWLLNCKFGFGNGFYAKRDGGEHGVGARILREGDMGLGRKILCVQEFSSASKDLEKVWKLRMLKMYLWLMDGLLSSGLWLLKKLKNTHCIHQLTFTNDPDLQNTFFYKLGCVCAGTTFSTFYLHWDDCILKLLRVRFTYGNIPFFSKYLHLVIFNFKI